MADFPLANLQDAAQFGFEQEDKGIRSEMDGGYVLTRPRFTGGTRRTWKTGLTDLSNTDKQTFEAFFSIYGTFNSFNYTVPTGDGTFIVRFKQAPKYEYKGYGTNYRWNVTDIYLEEIQAANIPDPVGPFILSAAAGLVAGGVAISSASVVAGGGSISYAVSPLVVDHLGAYSFTINRTGNTTGSSTASWSTAPSSLSNRLPTTSADFGGTYPSGTVNFLSGETSKTIIITPTTSASPE